MTLLEMLDTNANITDLYIMVRDNTGKLMDAYFIGPDAGTKPPYPLIIHYGQPREATYKCTSINSWDDYAEYWKVKTSKIPKKYLDMTVEHWTQRYVSLKRHRRFDCNPATSYEALEVTLVPEEYIPVVPDQKEKEVLQMEGQTNIFDFL